MRFLVQGAGIAGLTLARALRHQAPSTEVVLVERAPGPAAAGAGITLGPNAQAVLDALQLGPALGARGHRIDRLEVQAVSGRTLSAMTFPPDARRGVLAIHRADLHDVLAAGVPVRFGTSITELRRTGAGWRATLTDGTVVEADVVVGADGIGSALRGQLVDTPPRRIYAGYTCWRFVVPAPGDHPHGAEIWGRGQRVGLIPIGPDDTPRLYVFVVEDAPAGTPKQPTDRAALRERFAHFPAPALAAFDALDPDAPMLHHDIESLSAPAWGAGPGVLIGDAAHALTPNMGQGAAMAIEDAWVLARLVATRRPPRGLAEALAAARGKRVTEVARNSERIGRVGQWSNPVAAWMRDTMAALTPDIVGERQARGVFEGGPLPA